MHERALSRAQPDCVFGKGVKNWLEFKRRPTDDLEEFACRRLLLESDHEFAVARLHFLEKTRVLDRDIHFVSLAMMA